MQGNESMIQAVREYFMACPILKEGHIYVDYLDDRITDYSIDPSICDLVVKRYRDGGSLRRYQFSFMSTEIYSQSAIEAVKNSGFYEELADWIEEQNSHGRLPVFSGADVQSIKVLSPGCLFDAEGTVARYQIQIEIQYTKEAYI